MKNKDKLKLGFSACYQQDYGIQCLVGEIPVSVAIAWARSVLPPQFIIGSSNKDTLNFLTDKKAIEGGWLNKRFIIVGESHGYWISVYNHDGRFAIGIESN